MNPGAGEEIGKAANSTIDALKTTPIVLALLFFNVVFMGLTFWTSQTTGERFERVVTAALKQCAILQKE